MVVLEVAVAVVLSAEATVGRRAARIQIDGCGTQ